MGLYRSLYGAIAEPLIFTPNRKSIHGSTVRDIFIEHVAKGRWAVDDHAEKLLKELVEDGLLRVGNMDPTLSQRAFAGLFVSGKAYRDAGWVPGLIEHFWYTIVDPRPGGM